MVQSDQSNGSATAPELTESAGPRTLRRGRRGRRVSLVFFSSKDGDPQNGWLRSGTCCCFSFQWENNLNLTVCYWTWPMELVDLPIQHCDFA